MRNLTSSGIGRPRRRALVDLRRWLKTDKEFPDGLLPSEQVLAERLGVSKSTTHCALSRLAEEGLLRCEGRQWLITSSTQAMNIRKPTVIFAEDWHDMTHPSCACLLQGVMNGGSRNRLRVQVELLKHGDNFKEENPSLWNEIAEEKADGLIIPWISEQFRCEIRKINRNLSIVFTHSRLPDPRDPRAASVVYDWRSAGFQSMFHLLGSGARNILVMTINNTSFMAGCEDALAAEPGVSTKLRHEIVGMDDDMEALARRLATEAPDAIAFSDDRMASKVLNACEKIIPHFWKKTKVVSTDNLGMKSVLPAPVVRICFDPKTLGEAVMSSMVALIDDRPGSNSILLIKPELAE